MKPVRKKINVKNLFVFLLVLICLPLGNVLFIKGLNTKDEQLSYQENGDVTYKVYLKENKFFEEEYLDMNKVYITSLIDYIDTNFTYNIVFDKPSSGTYTYSVKAILSADTTNSSGNYWSKEYQLSNGESDKFTNKNVINFDKKVKIDYQKYNDLLMNFKKEYGLTMDGSLKVYLDIDIKLDSDTKASKKSFNPQINVPLTQATIEVPIGIQKALMSGYLKISEKPSVKSIICKYSGIVVFLIGSVLAIYLTIVVTKKGEKQYAYVKKLNKILKTYDGIIVNVNKSPDIDNISVINVEDFNELLDAHSEVRLPINYYDDEDTANFILIGNNMAWKYILEKEKVFNEKKKKDRR